MKAFLISTICIFLYHPKISAQLVSDLNTSAVSELDAIQLPSGTLISVSMEYAPTLGIGYRVVIHRSTDNGTTWSLEESFETEGQYNTIGDPVLALDTGGKPHLLFMSLVENTFFNVHLHMYVSEDDGKNWSILSKPYCGQELADTPQLLIDENNTFYISYTEFHNSTILPSVTHFIKSEDSGINWSEPKVFDTSQSEGHVGSYINSSNGNQINLVYGDYSLPFTYYTSSSDEGVSWNEVIEFPDTKEFAISKIISHKNHENICVLVHQAHNPTSGINIMYSLNNGLDWDSYFLVQNASMAEGYMDENGNIHLTYNRIDGNQYTLNYIHSMNGGVTFSDAEILFQDQIFEDPLPPQLLNTTGESQSMLYILAALTP